MELRKVKTGCEVVSMAKKYCTPQVVFGVKAFEGAVICQLVTT